MKLQNNYINLLKNALIETVSLNEQLVQKVDNLEQQITQKDEEIQQKDLAIAELAASLDNLMAGELMDTLRDMPDSPSQFDPHQD